MRSCLTGRGEPHLIGYRLPPRSVVRRYAAFVIHEDGDVDTEHDLARLTALLDETALAVVVEGSHFDAGRRKANRVLARAGDPGTLAELRSALRCVPRSQRLALMTPGEPTVRYSLLTVGTWPPSPLPAPGTCDLPDCWRVMSCSLSPSA